MSEISKLLRKVFLNIWLQFIGGGFVFAIAILFLSMFQPPLHKRFFGFTAILIIFSASLIGLIRALWQVWIISRKIKQKEIDVARLDHPPNKPDK